MRQPRHTPRDRRAARLIALSTTRQQPHGASPGQSAGLLALAQALEASPADALVASPSAAATQLRDAVRILCGEARAADPVRAERLLIALRGTWEGLAVVRGIPELAVRRALWERVVALCVEEFYAPTPAPRALPAVATSAA
jgi:hypothetical protein